MQLKIFSTIVAAMAMCVTTIGTAEAQRPMQNRNRGFMTQRYQMRNLITSVERSSNAFRAAVEARDRNTSQRTARDGGYRERFFDELTPHVQQMDQALERLRNEAVQNRPRAGRDEMVEVLSHARMVDRYFMSNSYGWGDPTGVRQGNSRRYTYRRSGNLDSRWRDLRRDINALARMYGINGLSNATARRDW